MMVSPLLTALYRCPPKFAAMKHFVSALTCTIPAESTRNEQLYKVQMVIQSAPYPFRNARAWRPCSRSRRARNIEVPSDPRHQRRTVLNPAVGTLLSCSNALVYVRPYKHAYLYEFRCEFVAGDPGSEAPETLLTPSRTRTTFRQCRGRARCRSEADNRRRSEGRRRWSPPVKQTLNVRE